MVKKVEEGVKRSPGRPRLSQEARRVLVSYSLDQRTVRLLRSTGNAGRMIDELVEKHFRDLCIDV